MALTQEQKEKLFEVIERTGGSREVMLSSRSVPDAYRAMPGQVERQEMTLSFEGLPPVRVILSRAPGRKTPCPLHINFHGGGFILPHNEDDDMYSAHLALGIEGIVLDVDYALTDRYPFPAASEQAYAVTEYAFSQCEAWGVDPGRISAGGHSAGGNLVEYVSMKAGQTGAFRLCLALLDYAATDNYMAMEMEGAERVQAFSMLYADGDIERLKDPFCSPIFAGEELLRGFPPVVIAEAGKCPFLEVNRRFGEKLQKAGVPVQYLSYLESRHGFSVRIVDDWWKAQEDFIEVIKKA